MSVLSQIYRYRALLHRRDAGGPLDISDVLTMEALGASLRMRPASSAVREIIAMLSTRSGDTCVKLRALGPDGVLCADCPELVETESLGLRLDDPSHNQSYLFRVALLWTQVATTQGSREAGLAFVGQPVVLHWGRGRGPAPAVVVELENTLRAA